MIGNHIKNFDYWLIGAVILLSLFGLIMVYSSSYPIGIIEYNNASYFFDKQLQWLMIGLVMFIITALFPYQVYGKLSPFLILVTIVLLTIV